MILSVDKLSVSTWTWHNPFYAGDLDLLDMPELASRAKINSIELNDFMLPTAKWLRVRNWIAYVGGYRAKSKKLKKYSRVTLNKLKGELEKHQVMCTSWSIDSDLTVDDLAWRDELAYIIVGFKTAQKLGAQFLRFTLGGTACMGSEMDMIVSSRLKLISAIKQELYPLVEPIVENHWGLSTEPERFLAIMSKAPEIGICLDPGNLPDLKYEANWKPLIAKTKLFHLKIYDLDLEQIDRNLDYRMIFTLLAQQNYSGKFVIEYEGDENPDMILSSFLKNMTNWKDTKFRQASLPKRTSKLDDSIVSNDSIPIIPPTISRFSGRE